MKKKKKKKMMMMINKLPFKKEARNQNGKKKKMCKTVTKYNRKNGSR
jgi:hypothetical protein